MCNPSPRALTAWIGVKLFRAWCRGLHSGTPQARDASSTERCSPSAHIQWSYEFVVRVASDSLFTRRRAKSRVWRPSACGHSTFMRRLARWGARAPAHLLMSQVSTSLWVTWHFEESRRRSLVGSADLQSSTVPWGAATGGAGASSTRPKALPFLLSVRVNDLHAQLLSCVVSRVCILSRKYSRTSSALR